MSTATVLEVPLNPSITTTAGCATQATLVQSNGANPVGPRDAVSVDQKDGHLDVQVVTVADSLFYRNYVQLLVHVVFITLPAISACTYC